MTGLGVEQDRVKIGQAMLLVGFVALIAGGLLSASFAHQSSQLMMWAVAYLVLVVGVAQIIIGGYFKQSGRESASHRQWAALLTYNLANIMILLGRSYKVDQDLSAQLLAAAGIGLFVVALGLILWSVRFERSWQALLFYGVTTLLLVSTPVGLWLTFMY